MINNVAAFCALVFASALALCWYPLGIISQTYLVDTQILFYAFSAGSVLSIPFLFKQAGQWRPHTPTLVVFALVSSVANTLLQYSLLSGSSLIIVSIICIVLSALLLFTRVEADQTLDFIVTLSVLVLGLVMLFLVGGGLTYHWTELAASLVALLFFGLLRLDKYSAVIPLGSKLSASLLASTWIIGMITIFSGRFSSYIQDNAVGLSVTYGSLCLIPIVASVLYVLSSKGRAYVLLWLPLLLSISFISYFIGQEAALLEGKFWIIGLLASLVLLQIFRVITKSGSNL